MKATQILMNEHRIIERVLDTLDIAVYLLREGVSVRPGLFLEAADFIRDFADGCHHLKEEGVLFESMARNGVPVERGPIGVMLADHEMGRRYTRQMRAVAERLQAGEMDAMQEVISSAEGYSRLLRSHIFKEDRVLFPMAEGAIPTDESEILIEDFERVEHEKGLVQVYEKYVALAQSLALEVEGLRSP